MTLQSIRTWFVALSLVLIAGTTPMYAVRWLPFGPDGGDARRIATDPRDHNHLYLGTTNGWIYESRTGGNSWTRLAQVGKRDDLVLDSIVVDAQNAKHLIVGAWASDHQDGGVFISYDAGATWISQAEMRGQSVRALAASLSDPKTLVAGSLQGVFRSTDGGQRWKRISPLDNAEIHDIQSLAIDPKDPNIVYAGTWHLPWKTADAGEHWDTMKQGIIEDSDVFSIIVDPIVPDTVYASACSGIYKSDNAGTLFHKVQGIPSTARRTRVLMQDPQHRDTVFAGTTEGLYRSDDSGRTWARTTGPEFIINDVSIDRADPRRVLIATDRGGVMASDDGGDTFHLSNGGFSSRQITTLKRDASRPATVFVGVVNDKDWGGVFQSDNGGLNWTQRSEGLEGRDVFTLGQAPDGTMIAGTSHGLFRLDSTAQNWQRVQSAPGANVPVTTVQTILTRPPLAPARTVAAPRPAPKTLTRAQRRAAAKLPRPGARGGRKSSGKVVAKGKPVSRKARLLAARKGKAGKLRGIPPPRKLAGVRKAAPAAPAPVVAMVLAEKKAPIFDGGVNSIVTAGRTLLATTSVGLLTSQDDGVTWIATGPKGSGDWRYLAATHRRVLAAGLHSLATSSDAGILWDAVRMPESLTQVSAISIEPNGEIWVGGREGLFVTSDNGATWTTPKNLYVNAVNNIFYDETADRMMITTGGNASIVFTVQLPSKQVNFTDTGWNLRFARPMGDHLIAVTLFDGVVVQPRMMPTPAAASTPLPNAPSAAPMRP